MDAVGQRICVANFCVLWCVLEAKSTGKYYVDNGFLLVVEIMGATHPGSDINCVLWSPFSRWRCWRESTVAPL